MAGWLRVLPISTLIRHVAPVTISRPAPSLAITKSRETDLHFSV
jgi:hypothetical protein